MSEYPRDHGRSRIRVLHSLSMRLDSLRRDPWSTMIRPSLPPIATPEFCPCPVFPDIEHEAADKCPVLAGLLVKFKNPRTARPCFASISPADWLNVQKMEQRSTEKTGVPIIRQILHSAKKKKRVGGKYLTCSH